ncbi:uncharacterized protein DS421_15g490040 [Arachis hypogaea]|nr:uncharacterized protein DS421_15g490040 [Arachis hypogaea]
MLDVERVGRFHILCKQARKEIFSHILQYQSTCNFLLFIFFPSLFGWFRI